MKKTSRKILVPSIILTLEMALASTVSAADYSGQWPGPDPIPGLTTTSGQHLSVDNYRFDSGRNVNTGHNPDHDFNQWAKNGHDSTQWDKGHNFKSAYYDYWNYAYKPYHWYHQFTPYYYRYYTWSYSSPFHHPYDPKKN